MKKLTLSQSLQRINAGKSKGGDDRKSGGFLGGEYNSKVEKIPTTFVFDKRIPTEEYKNYISIDDIFNENFEHARKLFEDPSRVLFHFNSLMFIFKIY